MRGQQFGDLVVAEVVEHAQRSQPVGLLRRSCEVRHVPALISLIESGIGIGAVPRFSIPQAPHGRLVAVKLTEPQVVRMIGVIKPRGRPLTAAAQALRDLLASPQALVPRARGSRRKRS